MGNHRDHIIVFLCGVKPPGAETLSQEKIKYNPLRIHGVKHCFMKWFLMTVLPKVFAKVENNSIAHYIASLSVF